VAAKYRVFILIDLTSVGFAFVAIYLSSQQISYAVTCGLQHDLTALYCSCCICLSLITTTHCLLLISFPHFDCFWCLQLD